MTERAYISVGRVPVEEVVNAMNAGVESLVLHGQKVKLTSIRIRTYTKGVKCMHCPRVGHFFSVEKQAKGYGNGYHLNLYHEMANGRLIMMTSDHIIPKSLNGDDEDLDNRQCLCTSCNSRKGNNMEQGQVVSEAMHAYLEVKAAHKKLIKAVDSLSRVPDSKGRKKVHSKAYNKFLEKLREFNGTPGKEEFSDNFEL